MDRKHIDDNHVVARYLACELSEAECEEFESCYLEDPDLLKEIEATARFKSGLASLAFAGQLDQLLSTRSPTQSSARADVQLAAVPDDNSSDPMRRCGHRSGATAR